MLRKKGLSKIIWLFIILVIIAILFSAKPLYYVLIGTGHIAKFTGNAILWLTENNKDRIMDLTIDKEDELDKILKNYDESNETLKYKHMLNVIDYVSKTNVTQDQLNKIKKTFKGDKDFLGMINRTIKK